MNKILKTMAVFALGIALYAPNALAGAFGVSPPWITNENLKPGSNYVYVIDLSTNDPREDMSLAAKLTGDPEILQWVTIKDKDNLIMPAGQQHVPLYVEVNVPSDARLGKYSGNISLTVSPKVLRPDSVSILLGGNIAITLKVIDYDVIDYWVKSATAYPVVEGQPIGLGFEIKNLGNTPLNSIETKVQVLDYSNGKLLATLTGGALNKPIYPQTLGTAEVSLPNNLMAGQYWLKVDVLKNGRSVYNNKLYLDVGSAFAHNSVKTAVRVAMEGESFQPSAPSYQPEYGMGQGNVQVRTTVTVRAPFTNQLILIVIGLMLVIIGISVRIYTTLRHEKHGHHHPHHH